MAMSMEYGHGPMLEGIWYWKDLLSEAGVSPNSLETWDGYITAAKNLTQFSCLEG